MLGSIGDVASNCGPNPCGMLEGSFGGLFATSPECETWRACSAVQSPMTAGPCIVGGLDENGNTIVSCGGAPPCLTGPGPLQAGQTYCPGVLEGEQAASQQYFASLNPIGIPQWALLGGAVFLIAMVAMKR